MDKIATIVKNTHPIGICSKLKNLELLDEVILITPFLNVHYDNISFGQRFYHIRNDIYHIINCKICNEQPAKYNKNIGYVPCSKKCVNIKASTNYKKAVREKYGVENTSKVKHIKDKIITNYKKAVRKKYGVDNTSQVDSIIEKIDYNKIFEKSAITNGGIHPFLDKNVRKNNINKHKQTFKEKYGNENYFRTNDYKEKNKKTCQEKYGVDHYFQSKEFKILYKQIMMELYGVDNPAKSKEIQEKFKKTCQDRYGVDHYSKSPEFLNKLIQTSRIKFGVDSFFQSKEFRRKTTKTYREKFGVDHYVQSNDYIEKYRLKYFLENLPEGYEAVEYGKIIELEHTKCKKDFEIDRDIYNLRRNRRQEICLECFPLYGNQWSFAEKELADFITSIYNGEIVLNNRKIIYPYELDIYLPKPNMAFEFNGTYYHADPRFYKPNDIILNHIAQSIWDRDRKKKLKCEKKGIILKVVWENDWINNKKEIQNKIKDILYQVN